MSKKKSSKTATTRTSSKQKFAEYKQETLSFINSLKYLGSVSAFSTKTYDVSAAGKKAVVLSAPEIFAIVATAAKLGKTVTVSTSGVGDYATLEFRFVDGIPNTPLTLL
jgi:hypothetical protein